jgi:hypothetical protein
LFGGVSEGFPEAVDGRIEAVFEIDEGVARPQAAT